MKLRTSQLFKMARSLEALGSQFSRDHVSPSLLFFRLSVSLLSLTLITLGKVCVSIYFFLLFFFFAENKLRLVGTSATMDTKLRHYNENCFCELLTSLVCNGLSLLFDARYGRVNFVLASRLELLKEVQRLQVKQPYNFFCVCLFVCLLLFVLGFFQSLSSTFDLKVMWCITKMPF